MESLFNTKMKNKKLITLELKLLFSQNQRAPMKKDRCLFATLKRKAKVLKSKLKNLFTSMFLFLWAICTKLPKLKELEQLLREYKEGNQIIRQISC